MAIAVALLSRNGQQEFSAVRARGRMVQHPPEIALQFSFNCPEQFVVVELLHAIE